MVRKEWSVAYSGATRAAQRVNRSGIGFRGAFKPHGVTGGAADEGAGANCMRMNMTLGTAHHFGARGAQGLGKDLFNRRGCLGCKDFDAALDGEEAAKGVIFLACVNHHGHQLSGTRQHVLVGNIVECVAGGHALGVGRLLPGFKGVLESVDGSRKSLVRGRRAAKIKGRTR